MAIFRAIVTGLTWGDVAGLWVVHSLRPKAPMAPCLVHQAPVHRP